MHWLGTRIEAAMDDAEIVRGADVAKTAKVFFFVSNCAGAFAQVFDRLYRQIAQEQQCGIEMSTFAVEQVGSMRLLDATMVGG